MFFIEIVYLYKRYPGFKNRHKGKKYKTQTFTPARFKCTFTKGFCVYFNVLYIRLCSYRYMKYDS